MDQGRRHVPLHDQLSYRSPLLDLRRHLREESGRPNHRHALHVCPGVLAGQPPIPVVLNQRKLDRITTSRPRRAAPQQTLYAARLKEYVMPAYVQHPATNPEFSRQLPNYSKA